MRAMAKSANQTLRSEDIFYGRQGNGGGQVKADQGRCELLKLPECAFNIKGIGECWDDYFQNRGISPVHADALKDALSVPMTILMAIRRFRLSTSPGELIRVDLPGSRNIELLNIDLMYGEMSKALSHCRFKLRLVGPELKKEGSLQKGNVFLSCHKVLYQDLLGSPKGVGDELPHLVVACNAGISKSWLPAMDRLVECRIPVAITGYDLHHAAASLRFLNANLVGQLQMVNDGVNPFCGSRMSTHVESVSCTDPPPSNQSSVVEEVQHLERMYRKLDEGDCIDAEQYLAKMHRRDDVRLNSHWFLFQGCVMLTSPGSLNSMD